MPIGTFSIGGRRRQLEIIDGSWADHADSIIIPTRRLLGHLVRRIRLAHEQATAFLHYPVVSPVQAARELSMMLARQNGMLIRLRHIMRWGLILQEVLLLIAIAAAQFHSGLRCLSG